MLSCYRYDHLLPPKMVKNGDDNARRFKQDIAKELNEIHLEMQKLLIHKQVPSARLVQRLGGIVKLLDNSPQPSTNVTNETVSKDSSVDVCPDVFKGPLAGYPFFEEG